MEEALSLLPTATITGQGLRDLQIAAEIRRRYGGQGRGWLAEAPSRNPQDLARTLGRLAAGHRQAEDGVFGEGAAREFHAASHQAGSRPQQAYRRRVSIDS